MRASLFEFDAGAEDQRRYCTRYEDFSRSSQGGNSCSDVDRDARDVVSAAAGFTLDQGRLPTYIHDRDNGSSGFVARAVGFQLYAEIVLSEY